MMAAVLLLVLLLLCMEAQCRCLGLHACLQVIHIKDGRHAFAASSALELVIVTTTTCLGCGLHEVMTAGEQALVLNTVRQNLVIPAICSEIIAAHSGTASITVNYGCQRSYLHGDPTQQ